MSSSEDPNVVYMAAGKRSSPNTQMLGRSWERGVGALDETLAHMMDKVDDALFEMAEKAESNNAQMVYFDAMRTVRRARSQMEASFRTHLRRAYEDFTARRGQAKKASDRDETPAETELTLVDDEEMEESLAITNMVSKAQNQAKQELFALHQRLAALLGVQEIEEDTSPLGPRVIATAFRDACRELDAETKVKLIILKLFDRFVINELPAIYAQINAFLRDHDVLPEIRVTIPRQPQQPTRGARHTQPGASAGTDEQAMETQQGADLLALLQQATHLPLETRSAVPSGLIQQLTTLQQSDNRPAGGSSPAPVSRAEMETTNVIRQLRESDLDQHAGHTEGLVMDMVAMLFDYVMADREIPDGFKALAGRLQIPILKVALVDKTFFSRKGHPARRLLDAISRSAVRSPADPANRLYEAAREAIEQINEEFTEDIGCFEHHAQILERLIEAHEDEVDETEADTRSTEQTKERVAMGRLRAGDAIDSRLTGREVPAFVTHFLREHWTGFMVLRYVRDGGYSEPWHQALSVIDRLLWSIEPKPNPADRRLLVSELPALVRQLRGAMEAIAMPADEREIFLDELAAYHHRIITGSSGAAAQATSPLEPVGDTPPATDTAESGASELSAEDDTATAPGPVTETAAETALRALGFSDERIGEMLADGPAFEEITLGEDPAEADTVEEDDYTALARDLTEGTWLEFHEADERITRAKLSWISPITGSYLFTDWQGVRYADKTVHGVAAALRRGDARVVEDVSFLDRAMSSVFSGWRSNAAR